MDRTAPALPDDDFSNLYRALGETYRFAALLYWPGDERRQAEAVATWATTMMGVVEQVFDVAVLRDRLDAVLAQRAAELGIAPAALRATPNVQKLLAEMHSPEGRAEVEARREDAARGIRRHALNPAGGFLRVSAAPGLSVLAAEQDKAVRGPEAMSGKLLFLLACTEKHHAQELASVSLSRLMRALEGPGHTVRWMKAAWANTRGAHLWAGLLMALDDELRTQVLSADAVERVLGQPEGRARVLGYAAWFLEWGQAFTPKGSSHPVLWRHSLVPVQVAPLEPNLPIVPQDLIGLMAAYRAPKDF